MTIHIDPAADPGKDPRRARFEKLQKDGGSYDELMALIQEFIADGHNPKDPTDAMYVILGISPEFLETMLFTLRTKPDATIDEFSVTSVEDVVVAHDDLEPEPVPDQKKPQAPQSDPAPAPEKEIKEPEVDFAAVSQAVPVPAETL